MENEEKMNETNPNQLPVVEPPNDEHADAERLDEQRVQEDADASPVLATPPPLPRFAPPPLPSSYPPPLPLRTPPRFFSSSPPPLVASECVLPPDSFSLSAVAASDAKAAPVFSAPATHVALEAQAAPVFSAPQTQPTLASAAAAVVATTHITPLQIDCKNLWIRTKGSRPCCAECDTCNLRFRRCRSLVNRPAFPSDHEACLKCTKPHGTRSWILKGVSVSMIPGRLMVIMGPSGCGKTTLMNECAGRSRTTVPHTNESISFNHQSVTAAQRVAISAYIEQTDVMLSTQTAREAIQFAATMGLSCSAAEKRACTDDVLRKLGLQHCANTVIGGLMSRGMSGGEKKRVSIGIELVKDPNVLFVDEPTSGLDIATAYDIVKILKTLAREGRTVVCTIHTPSAKMFDLFDDLLLLSQGRVLYSGPAPHALAHFEQNHNLMCPPARNQAEFLLSLVDPTSCPNPSLLVSDSHVPPESKDLPVPRDDVVFQDLGQFMRVRQLSYGVQMRHLTQVSSTLYTCYSLLVRPFIHARVVFNQRAMIHYFKEPRNIIARSLQNIGLAIFASLLYPGLGRNQRAVYARVGFIFFMLNMQALLSLVNAVLTFSEERAMYLREKASKLYHTSAYFLSKTLLDLPIQFLLTLCYGTIAYLSVGLQLHSELFFRFILVLVLIASCAQSLGLLLAATTPNAFVAMTLCPLCMVPFMLTSGFFLNVDSVPKAFDFLVALSPHRYLFSAALLTEFKNLKFYCDPQEALLAPSPSGPWALCPIEEGSVVLENFGMTHESFNTNIASAFALFLGFRLAAYVALRLK